MLPPAPAPLPLNENPKRNPSIKLVSGIFSIVFSAMMKHLLPVTHMSTLKQSRVGLPIAFCLREKVLPSWPMLSQIMRGSRTPLIPGKRTG